MIKSNRLRLFLCAVLASLAILWLGSLSVRAGTGDVVFHGLVHSPLGAAVLSIVEPGTDIAPSRHQHLTVSNIGSSGKDGVSIDLGGPAQSWQMTGSFDPQGEYDVWKVNFGATGTVDGAVSDIGVFTVDRVSSTALFIPDYSPVGTTSLTVQAFLGETLVAEVRGHPNGEPAARVINPVMKTIAFIHPPPLGGQAGIHRSPPDHGGQVQNHPVLVECEFEFVTSMTLPDGRVVSSDRLVVAPEDTTAALVLLDSVRITAADIPDFAIFDELVPNKQLDHFLSYQIFTAPTFVPRTVRLRDQFGLGSFVVQRPFRLFNPADKNKEGIIDPRTHLMGYPITPVAGQPPHEPVKGITVINQFGELVIDTKREVELLVPTAKTLGPPFVLPPPPDPTSHRVDHFKCYTVDVTPGTPPFPSGIQASVVDQFQQPKVYDVINPLLLCNPTDKNAEGIQNPEAHLMCYSIRPATGEPPHRRVIGLTSNQFSPQLFVTLGERELCLPSEKLLP